ncbi:unnamed protein product [Cercopithifilaria johnstoni]|uniref:Uncharacterized protein n=1 Tax=Cercopithifilaria johnstoni TaxID=2874296 RepID=A0A8J2Q0F3_9BILA|nr:unnamed protein product [Cercopithifilaria johnstoni]
MNDLHKEFDDECLIFLLMARNREVRQLVVFFSLKLDLPMKGPKVAMRLQHSNVIPLRSSCHYKMQLCGWKRALIIDPAGGVKG